MVLEGQAQWDRCSGGEEVSWLRQAQAVVAKAGEASEGSAKKTGLSRVLVGAMWIPQICALSLASALASVFWGGAALYETRCQVGLPQGRAADNVSREQEPSLAYLYIDVDRRCRRVCQADQGATRSNKLRHGLAVWQS